MARAALAALAAAAAASSALAAAPVFGSPTAVPATSSLASIDPTSLLNVGGIFPSLTLTADTAPTGPNVTSPRSECGVGAMMAWLDRLYVISYLSVPNAGAGTGLYQIDAQMQMTKLANHSSVYANRLMIPAINSIVIGPYVIDAFGNIRTFESLLSVRVGGMAEHIQTPTTNVYMLSMDGPLFDCSLVDMTCNQIFDLVEALNIPASLGEQPHFKAAHTMDGTLYVASNTFEQADAVGLESGGRLASWQGNLSAPWNILEETAFFEITGRHNMGNVVFAVGQDIRSVILKVVDYGDSYVDPSYDTAVQTYRLPKATHAYDHLWTTEWPRLREVETERYLLDAGGMFYEIPPFTWGGAVWGVKPISSHLRMIPDFASFRGFLVLGGNQVSSIFDANRVTGQSQSNFWFGKTDDLHSFGKPQGWGGPWLADLVEANTPSDAYLLTGFDKKVVHLRYDQNAPPYDAPDGVQVQVQVDFTGSAGHRGAHFFAMPWSTLTTVTLSPAPSAPGSGYAYYVIPEGFSAHWIRFVANVQCNCTAWLTYT